MTTTRDHFARIFPPAAVEDLQHSAEVRACHGKERYANGQLAAEVAKRRNHHSRRNVHGYRCRHCGWFHLGTNSQGRRR